MLQKSVERHVRRIGSEGHLFFSRKLGQQRAGFCRCELLFLTCALEAVMD